MLYRKITKRIEDYFASKSESRTSFAKSVKKTFSNYIEINVEEDKLGDRVFAQAKTTNDFYMALSIYAGDKMGNTDATEQFLY